MHNRPQPKSRQSESFLAEISSIKYMLDRIMLNETAGQYIHFLEDLCHCERLRTFYVCLETIRTE